jgi:hypothetical protein
MNTEERGRPVRFKIQIDRVHFTVDEPVLTGTQLRALPSLPIPSDRDLYEVRPGEDDLLIADDDKVTMRNGLRFFTAPGHINPGSSAEGQR